MINKEIIPNLFRAEYSKIVAVLSRLFGIQHIETVEDITSETFLQAADTWPYKGIPENPTAWLYTVAKNRTINHLKRNKIFREKISIELNRTGENFDELNIDLSDKNINDSQLRMFFAICHPAISEKAQISLALRILCGFGITEIADALMTNKESVNKLLQRAKEKLRTENIKLGMPDDDQLKTKLDTVLRTVYLLFNEGYYSESSGSLIRKDLCLEAINLAYLLLRHNITNTHETNSLISLMCFHSSRLEARMSETGEIILYEDQDEKLWDKALIEKGFYYLQQASKWEIVSKYYLEASIAYWHTVKNDTKEKWESILSLYNLLLKIDETPNAALNRIYALSKVKGNEYAVKELESQEFEENHFYYLLMGELYNDLDKTKAKESFVKAKNLCKTETGKKLIVKKLETLQA